MDQRERRIFLIKELLKERPNGQEMQIPQDEGEQKRLLRALMNVRMPGEISQEFLNVQDAYLQERATEKGIVNPSDLPPLQEGIYLWQGDITRLAADAIVNAANSGMTGCYQPNHSCIDNCIHTFAGMQMRLDCAKIMEKQGYEEPTGQAKITKAYNLPCQYVLHTVGPIVGGALTEEHCRLLASCYESCLSLAEEYRCKSIAFCCISTGVFGFPQKEAAEIAIRTVKAYRKKTKSGMDVIFNVFLDRDYEIYREYLDISR